MKADLGPLMKQAQRTQSEMAQAQEELANLEVQGAAGGGLVKLTMTCRHEVRDIRIDDSLLGDDRGMLEDILVAAFNDTLRKIENTVQEKYAGMAAGAGLPGGFKLPF